MINTDSRKITETLHALIIEAKAMLVFNKTGNNVYNFLDEIEYLPQLILRKSDETETFKVCLKRICERFECMRIYNQYCDSSL